MGYCISINEVRFTIKVEKQVLAFDLWRKLRDAKPEGTRSGFDRAGFAWTEGEALDACTTIGAVLAEFRYAPRFESDAGLEALTGQGEGDIIGLEFDGEKIGDEETLFEAIAPAVEKGSYIQASGDDGEIWRWVFDGETCTAVSPTWPPLPGDPPAILWCVLLVEDDDGVYLFEHEEQAQAFAATLSGPVRVTEEPVFTRTGAAVLMEEQ
jgi:hypothetical protein